MRWLIRFVRFSRNRADSLKSFVQESLASKADPQPSSSIPGPLASKALEREEGPIHPHDSKFYSGSSSSGNSVELSESFSIGPGSSVRAKNCWPFRSCGWGGARYLWVVLVLRVKFRW